MDLGISGKRAAVAAASAGLGLASAKALAREGVRVAICGREGDNVTSATAAVNSAAAGGAQAVAIVADVGTPAGATAFVEQAIGELGGIDILVTNAGGPPAGNFTTTGIEAYQGALDLNLMSVVAMCKAAVPQMQARGWGRVVAITSLAVKQPLPDLILSNTARAGATGFLKTLALEVARNGVTVNSVLPGFHATERLRELRGGDVSSLAAQIPVGFVGDPDDFGALVAFLSSQHARYITGTAVAADGGAYRGLL